MKLLIPAKFYVEGGIERVILSMLKEFDELIESVVIVLPQQSIETFRKALPSDSKIVFESANWPGKTIGTKQLRLFGYLQKMSKVVHLDFLETWALKRTQDIQTSGRIRFLAKKYKCTHCLYFICNRVPIPKGLNIPVVILCHDLFWHFAPMTYSPALIQQYDDSLGGWLKSADKVITVSNKTRQDLLTIFPGFEDKVEAVPSASDRPKDFFKHTDKAIDLLQQQGLQADQEYTFFFPSSFSLYKDHLTLLKASIQAFQSNPNFRVLMTGKDTDRLASGNFDMAKQKKTLEYRDYVEELQKLYFEHQQIWQSIFWGGGYCELAVVEAIYQTCSCIVMPSRYEGFGLAISEAIVRGIPVIAADLEVFHEQVELYRCSDRVQFFEAGNSEALQDCIQQFINNPIPRLSEAETSERFDHWTWRQVAEKYISALSSL